MAITLTSAVINSLTVRFSNGVASQLEVEYSGTDSNGDTRLGVHRFPPNVTQQTNIDNFLNNLITQVQTDINLTLTVAV